MNVEIIYKICDLPLDCNIEVARERARVETDRGANAVAEVKRAAESIAMVFIFWYLNYFDCCKF